MDPREVLKNETLFKQLASEAFKEYDTNKNGEIDVSELKAALTTFAVSAGAPTPDDAIIAETMKELDKNKSNTLTIDEFELYMRGILVQMCS